MSRVGSWLIPARIKNGDTLEDSAVVLESLGLKPIATPQGKFYRVQHLTGWRLVKQNDRVTYLCQGTTVMLHLHYAPDNVYVTQVDQDPA